MKKISTIAGAVAGLALVGLTQSAASASHPDYVHILSVSDTGTLEGRGIQATAEVAVQCSQLASDGLEQRVQATAILTQRQGRTVETYSTGTSQPCSGEAQSVEFTFTAYQGQRVIRTGEALLTVYTMSCSDWFCRNASGDDASEYIRLRR